MGCVLSAKVACAASYPHKEFQRRNSRRDDAGIGKVSRRCVFRCAAGGWVWVYGSHANPTAHANPDSVDVTARAHAGSAHAHSNTPRADLHAYPGTPDL